MSSRVTNLLHLIQVVNSNWSTSNAFKSKLKLALINSAYSKLKKPFCSTYTLAKTLIPAFFWRNWLPWPEQVYSSLSGWPKEWWGMELNAPESHPTVVFHRAQC